MYGRTQSGSRFRLARDDPIYNHKTRTQRPSQDALQSGDIRRAKEIARTDDARATAPRTGQARGESGGHSESRSMRRWLTHRPMRRSQIHGNDSPVDVFGVPPQAAIASASDSCSEHTRPRTSAVPKHSRYVDRPPSGVSHSTAYLSVIVRLPCCVAFRLVFVAVISHSLTTHQYTTSAELGQYLSGIIPRLL